MIGNRFVQLAHKFFTDKSFSYVLGTRTATILPPSTSTALKNQHCFSYTIPKRLCRTFDNNASSPALTIGPIIALFDELSSFGFMAKDSNRRGGVSVYLSANLIEIPVAGDEVIIETTIQ